MNRLLSRVGVRVASVSLLVAGAATGIYLGTDREVQQSAEASTVAQVAAVDDVMLLKQRQAEHAAARASRREAEGDAAAKAATAAKVAADKAHKLETKAIAKKKADEEAAKKKAEEEAAKKKADSDEDSGSTPEFTGDIPASCDEFSGNRAIGCSLMLDAGFKISQFSCLEKLWKKESGWNHKATNRSSGAYGIPQALPGSKMASAGSDWKSNPATQIEWGLGYIEGRYGTPCSAWGHSQDVGWY
ncbi:lytic transglycosylase domain-containing protein [Actinoplanes sp. Pm04-4]|uniref:Lytic transglycosylase domain-containing protein n=1 Tax=Paractinoplanes pyxinae TaxID=2997416 RepID=A0ABT4B2P5_9ACTN|nr:lytic transglycosylase domain-containing protein [Actinoplanes pyxinae]MCY1140768.1 lytic transglycosylase domain-containing protein [Actinoplanes pyxinae]